MQFERWVPVDLAVPCGTVVDIGFPTFTGDDLSVRFGAVITRDGEEVTAAGTVQGYVILPNGTTLPAITGDKEGNRCWIDLPEDAFALQGRIQVALRVTHGGSKTVLAAATGIVRIAGTTTAYDPDGVIPTWDDVQTKITQLDDAIEEIPTAVIYGSAQTLTDTQKAQARSNIGALGATVSGTTLVIS